MTKADIKNREDLMQLVKVFYEKLLSDARINYFFTDIAKINLEEHLPVLADFWDSVLFQKNSYHKNAVQLHTALHQLSPITKEHFKIWLNHFETTVDELFEGENAFAAKQRAVSIATIMQIKIAQLNKQI